MRYMYTTKPDEGCHEVEKGIYGRPVQTCDESKLRKAGWSLSIDSLRGAGYVREEKEGREEEVEVIRKAEADKLAKAGEEFYERDELAEQYETKFGKKPHHKMKPETIRQKLEEADDHDSL